MDDLVEGLIWLTVAAVAAMAYVALAAIAAGTLAGVCAIDSIGYALWRCATILKRAIVTRGGDQRKPTPPEPARATNEAPPWRGLGHSRGRLRRGRAG